LNLESSSDKRFAEVVLPFRSRKTYTYFVPERLRSVVRKGSIVVVSFRERRGTGVVIELKRETEIADLKEIIEVEKEISLKEEALRLAKWMAEYYVASLSETLKLFLPPRTLQTRKRKFSIVNFQYIPSNEEETKILAYLKRVGRPVRLETLKKKLDFDPLPFLRTLLEKEVIREDKVEEKGKKVIFDSNIQRKPIRLNSEQKAACERIIPYLRKGVFKSFLLYGVTGSGKTEVYIHLVREALNLSKGAIVLIPEISLTPQLLALFSFEFGELVSLYHSSLSASERLWIWKEFRAGRKKICIGPRSTLFLPVENLGIIIVDEEHDISYKQRESSPRYNARDVAIMRGKLENIPVVLGSATPSIESYFNAKRKKHTLIEIKKRVIGYKRPKVKVVDMREEQSEAPFSIKLIEELHRSLSRNKQAILFINRRGFAPHLQCLECSYIPMCPNCSLRLVFHKDENLLICHFCNYRKQVSDYCENCGSILVRPIGFGTQKVEKELREFFPKVTLERVDLDVARKKGFHEKIYRDFIERKVNILVGTQMVAKGFDFPEVDLVGILLADIGLGIPDFRAEERVFQLITQVIGRVRKGGKVILQTYSPENPAINFARREDYISFYEREISVRRRFRYPPFVRIALVEVLGEEEERVKSSIFKIKEEIEKESSGVEIKGPSPSPVYKTKGKYRWRIILKSKNLSILRKILKQIEKRPIKKINVLVDIDPQELF